MSQKGFHICDGKYYYCSSTNTLINSELKKIYSNCCSKRHIKVVDLNIDSSKIKKEVKSLSQVIFEITQQCNLKCKYCIYESGDYQYERPSSSESMSIETAYRVIDYIWELVRSRGMKKITFGFYGGEALIEYKKIKKIVSYSKLIFKDWELSYTITSNGTLLNNEIMDFLIENNFLVTISLDGPKENHDAKRIFYNGNGTHAIVIENLKRFRKKNKEFYDNKVGFSAIHSKDLPFADVFSFFKNIDLVKCNSVKLGYVVEKNTSYYERYPYSKDSEINAKNIQFKAILEKKKKGLDLSPIELNLFQSHSIIAELIERRDFYSHMGTCIFNSRLYVDANGQFHICEKMNNKFSIGNAIDGYDYDKMSSILKDYSRLIKEKCIPCEVNFLCQRCYIHFAGDGFFDITQEFCQQKKRSIKIILEEILEQEKGRKN